MTSSDDGSYISGVSGDLISMSTDDDFYIEEERNEKDEVEKLARNETRNVQVWRMVVLSLLAVTGAIVSTFTYKYLKSGQNDDFVDAYYLFSNTIEDITQIRVQSLFRSHRDLTESIAGYSISSGNEWPFVTPPMFEIEAEHLRVQSGVEGIVLAPLVTKDQRIKWETYSVQNQGWIEESRMYTLNKEGTLFAQEAPIELPITPYVQGVCGPSTLCPLSDDVELLLPSWLMSPPPFLPLIVNIDMNLALIDNFNVNILQAVNQTRDISLHSNIDTTFLTGQFTNEEAHLAYHNQYVVVEEGDIHPNDRPHGLLANPVFKEPGNPDSDIVAVTMSVIAFDTYMAELLPDGVNGINLVVSNNCEQDYTYEISGSKARFLGEGDLHERKYDKMAVEIPFSDYLNDSISTNTDLSHCVYKFTVYPNETFASKYDKNLPIIFTSLIAGIFLLTIGVFLIYDLMGLRRNAKVVEAAARSNAIVSSLFPTNVKDQLLLNTSIGGVQPAPQAQLKSYLKKEAKEAKEARHNEGINRDGNDDIILPGKPLAELFPEATIMFADIAGFTAWSSVRDPAQVFTLLETLYRAFDDIARKRRIFKVETIGDCYVAVAGLPDPRKDHAVAMVRFANDCLHQMRVLTKRLEITLGPDTGDLALRIGLHSGPVTAGVLRGDKSRFQLFGDTMNTASRVESTGVRDRVQVSEETAKCLRKRGKGNWLETREDLVEAKGKGKLQTYFITMRTSKSMRNVTTVSMTETEDSANGLDETEWELQEERLRKLATGKAARLIDWTVDVLSRLIRQIIARRNACGFTGARNTVDKDRTIPLAEVKEIVTLPEFDMDLVKYQEDPDDIELEEELIHQLHDFVTNIAALYRDNPFHNFEHASHVTMSVVKLLGRIVSPTDLAIKKGTDYIEFASKLHDHTYGITSDPLTQFACVFSALIHDVDHTGVPNTQLQQENVQLAEYYQQKSLAEQNSVDLAWEILMSEDYDAIHRAAFPTEDEKDHFRQIVVNSVLATDIMDKDLKQLRNARWEKAFSEGALVDSTVDARNRKATIVIEHLIQASDVAHTMQHWHIYRKWNQRLFEELYKAYCEGRSASNPADFWYKGEIGFFDFYIIPLAKKLKDCGVFGVSSDEYLNYALRNREEWELRGEEIVAEMMETMEYVPP